MKTQLFRKMGALVAVTGVLIIASACGDVSGVDDGMGEVQVTLQEAAAEALFHVMATDIVAAPEATAGRVDRDDVVLLQVTVTDIQLLPYCEDSGEQNGDGQCEDLWVPLELGDDAFVLRLDSLPGEGDDPIVLANTTVPAGEYHKIRLFVSDAIVAFGKDITVGHAVFFARDSSETYDLEEPSTWLTHDLEIPSAQNTGIKVDIDLVVEEGAEDEVALLFDAEATYANVIATGSGRVKMPPVLKVRPQNQEQNKNQNQNGNGS